MSGYIELKDEHSEKVSYNHPDYPIYLHRRLLSYYPNYAGTNHWHDDIELIAVLSGGMDYNVNGEIVLLHPMLLCPHPSYERDFVLPLIHNGSAPFAALRADIGWQRDIYRQILFMYEKRDSETAPMAVQAAFSAIWRLFYEHVPTEDRKGRPQSADLTITKNMVGFIQKNYARKLTLADIAASGAVGQSKCCKLFAKYFSQTPNLYLNQYRLNKSAELLRGTDMPITAIAFSVGFSGASYYAETFRKWFGKSPTEFRNGLYRPS